MRRSLLRGFTRRFAEAPGRWRAIWLITEEPASTMPRLIAARLLQTVLRAPGQICITVSSQRAYREALTEDLLQSGLCLATLSDCNFRERSVYPPGKTVGWSALSGGGTRPQPGGGGPPRGLRSARMSSCRPHPFHQPSRDATVSQPRVGIIMGSRSD